MPFDEPSRRQFLAFLASSPLLAAAGLDDTLLTRLLRGDRQPDDAALRIAHALAQPPAKPVLAAAASDIRTPAEALDVFDFEPVARQNIPVAHWGYLATGSDDDATIQANRQGFDRWALKPRRLIDVSRLDTSLSLFGTRYPTPIVINPVGSQKAFHPLGEVAVARAAKAKDHLMVLSTVATTSIEDAIAARGGPVWFQLYHQSDWAITKQMVQRAERAGAPAIVFTVDLLGGSNRETMIREARKDTRTCTKCHLGGAPLPGISGRVDDRDNRRKPNLVGYQKATPIPEVGTPTWEFVDRLKQSTSMKVLLKGIVTAEDAQLAVQHGVDGLFVSNHGGRAENSRRATVTSLPEVVLGAAGRIPVICDGGFRRGTDVFKAMALGATAIGIGRPYIWGLGAFGQEGVEAVLGILRREFEVAMKQSGTTSLAAITNRHITPA
ncbi:MAG: alpha-hydroxy acid oxidase [Gemmatimonadota bacterium]|jgi:isopentenyl diphosphate isomerase/L-lactate dehydrogenase-like FMN-dependent dehydrogenase|nr:alpha-hydroxy acid oxidase [Gemmatimonadota bacterium]MDQ8173664.1 alpha-hydroxy acid oxidase [Gemmatimonadota bacterium]